MMIMIKRIVVDAIGVDGWVIQTFGMVDNYGVPANL